MLTAPDPITFNTCISACQKGLQWELALHLLASMPTARATPDEISYNSGISACQKGSQWQMALELVSEMHTQNLRRDVISFSAAVSALERDGLWQLALLILQEMPALIVAPSSQAVLDWESRKSLSPSSKVVLEGARLQIVWFESSSLQ